jgi:hypothetical protein
LTGTGSGFASPESVGRDARLAWNLTDPFLRLKPEPLAAYLSLLLTLVESG